MMQRLFVVLLGLILLLGVTGASAFATDSNPTDIIPPVTTSLP